MAAPFFGAIRATVASAPGTGPITPGALVTGFRAWSNLPANIIVDYRLAEPGDSAWEVGYAFWNGVTLQRGLKYSSTGALINASASATVLLSIGEERIGPHIGHEKWMLWSSYANNPAATFKADVTVSGTLANGVSGAATGSYLARQERSTATSAATAGSGAGLQFNGNRVHLSTTAMMGGFEFVSRWGITDAASGNRFIAGVNTAVNNDPSTRANSAGFIKDAADTTLSFMSRGTALSKVDTGMAYVADATYETAIWANPGERRLYWSIARLDTGATAYGVVTDPTLLPAVDTLYACNVIAGNGANAVATTLALISVYIRAAS